MTCPFGCGRQQMSVPPLLQSWVCSCCTRGCTVLVTICRVFLLTAHVSHCPEDGGREHACRLGSDTVCARTCGASACVVRGGGVNVCVSILHIFSFSLFCACVFLFQHVVFCPFLESPGGASGKDSACHYRRLKRPGFNPLGWEDPLEEGMATHSSILSWKMPWTEEPGGLQSMGSHRVRHSWACTHSLRCVTFSCEPLSDALKCPRAAVVLMKNSFKFKVHKISTVKDEFLPQRLLQKQEEPV